MTMILRLILFVAAGLFLPRMLSAQQVIALHVDDAITPVTASYIQRGIETASESHASCLLIHLNTPGGLLTSTRKIVGDILESPIPVIVYVSPSGSRAGSAGVFITLAAHIAAMAPGTNIGASHPVNLQGGIDSTMNEKVTNDAAAFIRTIATKRNRDVVWAEDAVRRSVSITETEALDRKVIDLIAPSTSALLDEVDGRRIAVESGFQVLHTRDATIKNLDMGFGEKLLAIICNPNIMYILLLLGMCGILFEFYNPGAIIPGVVGVISLILVFYSMSALPINYAGLALIVFAIVLFLLELKITSHGILAIGGIVSLLLGSLMLIRTGPAEQYVRISRIVIFTSVALTAAFFLFIIGLGLRAQRGRPVSGMEGFIGEYGRALDDLAPLGKVQVHGEIWRAESVGQVIAKGTPVRVVRVEGLKIWVDSVDGEEMVEPGA
jgi:membrane-bound serine protease (ClpP class)